MSVRWNCCSAVILLLLFLLFFSISLLLAIALAICNRWLMAHFIFNRRFIWVCCIPTFEIKNETKLKNKWGKKNEMECICSCNYSLHSLLLSLVCYCHRIIFWHTFNVSILNDIISTISFDCRNSVQTLIESTLFFCFERWFYFNEMKNKIFSSSIVLLLSAFNWQ